MKKTWLQKILNVLFYIAFIFSWYMVYNYAYSPWKECGTLLTFIVYALLFLTGFFHHIAYKYSSFKTLSNVILVLFGIISITFTIINTHYWHTAEIVAVIIFVLLLLFHLISCGKYDGEIKLHEFNVKMEDGRYEKVTVKERIPDNNNPNKIGAKTVIKKLIKTILIVVLIPMTFLVLWGILIIVDSESNLIKNINSLPTEIVSQEYLDEFNLNDYVRTDFGSRYLGLTLKRGQCYYGNDVEYIFASEPTRIISDSNKADENTYWQMGNNKNLIMNLVDEDWGSYSRAYYLNKNCVFPNENNKIIKVIAEFDKELKFSKKQLNYIENSIKNFDNDVISKDKNDWLNEYESLDDYALVFCFEGFDDIYLTCCSIIKDKNGQWYLYNNTSYPYYSEEIKFYDLEKLPQDICDTINESLK